MTRKPTVICDGCGKECKGNAGLSQYLRYAKHDGKVKFSAEDRYWATYAVPPQPIEDLYTNAVERRDDLQATVYKQADHIRALERTLRFYLPAEGATR